MEAGGEVVRAIKQRDKNEVGKKRARGLTEQETQSQRGMEEKEEEEGGKVRGE